jgi:hypothetical protein
LTYGREETEDRPSKAWYAVPILLGIIGGLIMYFALRGRDERMAKLGCVVGIMMFFVSIGGGAAIIFFGSPMSSTTSGNVMREAISMTNTHLWVSPDGRAAAALVISNLGSETVSVDSITVRAMPVPQSSWHYNIVDAIPENVQRDLQPDFTHASVNVDSDPQEEIFLQPAGPLFLESGKSVILYISDPSRIGKIDVGLTFTIQVNAGRASAVQPVSVFEVAA